MDVSFQKSCLHFLKLWLFYVAYCDLFCMLHFYFDYQEVKLGYLTMWHSKCTVRCPHLGVI